MRAPHPTPSGLVTLAAAATLFLAPAATASAKELASIRVCGSSGCTSFAGGGGHDAPILQSGALVSAPVGGAPFYRVTFRMAVPGSAPTDGPRWTVLYVPAKGVIRSGDPRTGKPMWLALLPDQRAAFEKVARGIEPLPAARLPGVRAAPRPPAPDGGGVPAWL